jgi:WD repeat and SOF domain-containing protein 1
MDSVHQTPVLASPCPAAKLDRVFAKPFLAALPHDDGVTCLARNPRRLNSLLSGAADGDVRLWDVPARRCLRRLVGHTGAVRGISMTADGEAAVSCGTDCTVKLWKVRGEGGKRCCRADCK